jgi:hypothetical protein
MPCLAARVGHGGHLCTEHLPPDTLGLGHNAWLCAATPRAVSTTPHVACIARACVNHVQWVGYTASERASCGERGMGGACMSMNPCVQSHTPMCMHSHGNALSARVPLTLFHKDCLASENLRNLPLLFSRRDTSHLLSSPA